MRTRDWRRQQNKRVKNNFIKDIKETYLYQSKDWIDWWCIKNYNNRKSCSCWMCGNPRKVFKEITLKEKIYSREAIPVLALDC